MKRSLVALTLLVCLATAVSFSFAVPQPQPGDTQQRLLDQNYTVPNDDEETCWVAPEWRDDFDEDCWVAPEWRD